MGPFCWQTTWLRRSDENHDQSLRRCRASTNSRRDGGLPGTCIEEADGDAAFIAKALGDIARAQGMTQVARDSGLSRESLHKALSSEPSPCFNTILEVVTALGLKLSAIVRCEAEVT
jgi:probable addiction module antidote protein